MRFKFSVIGLMVPTALWAQGAKRPILNCAREAVICAYSAKDTAATATAQVYLGSMLRNAEYVGGPWLAFTFKSETTPVYYVQVKRLMDVGRGKVDLSFKKQEARLAIAMMQAYLDSTSGRTALAQSSTAESKHDSFSLVSKAYGDTVSTKPKAKAQAKAPAKKTQVAQSGGEVRSAPIKVDTSYLVNLGVEKGRRERARQDSLNVRKDSVAHASEIAALKKRSADSIAKIKADADARVRASQDSFALAKARLDSMTRASRVAMAPEPKQNPVQDTTKKAKPVSARRIPISKETPRRKIAKIVPKVDTVYNIRVDTVRLTETKYRVDTVKTTESRTRLDTVYARDNFPWGKVIGTGLVIGAAGAVYCLISKNCGAHAKAYACAGQNCPDNPPPGFDRSLRIGWSFVPHRP